MAAALTPRTRLVAVSSVQYASGYRTDLDAVGALCERAGVLLCVDGIQSVGCIPVDVKRSRVHFLSADSHKWMLGISGIGFLYVAKEVLPRLRPVLVGWRSTTDAWNFNRSHFELRADAAEAGGGQPRVYRHLRAGRGAGAAARGGRRRPSRRASAGCSTQLDEGLRALGCETGPAPEHRAGILTFLPGAESRGRWRTG